MWIEEGKTYERAASWNRWRFASIYTYLWEFLQTKQGAALATKNKANKRRESAETEQFIVRGYVAFVSVL